MRDCPRSSLCAGIALQTVLRLPAISTRSPTASSSFSRSSGPMRAMPRPTSLLNASETLSLSAVTSVSSVAISAPSLDALDLNDSVVAADLHLLAGQGGRQQHLF